jgi:hypothetical protein
VPTLHTGFASTHANVGSRYPHHPPALPPWRVVGISRVDVGEVQRPANLSEAGAVERSPGVCTRDLTSYTNKSESESTTDNRSMRRRLIQLRRLVNRQTGEVVDVDPRVSRVRHMRRRVHAWANTCQMLDVQGRLVMVSLTYADGASWSPDDIAEYMNKVSHLLGASLLTYCWVSELQTRGAIHYHVLMLVRRGTDVPLPDKSGMWSHGSSNRGSAKSAWYILKYASKGDTGSYPQGARILGASWRHLREVAMTLGESAILVARRLVRLTMLPRWLIQALGADEKAIATVRRREGGGWCVGNAVYKSPWSVLRVGYVEA